MITRNLSEKRRDALYEERLSNDNLWARKRGLIVSPGAKGSPGHEVADIARVDEDTVTNAVKKSIQGGLACLLKEDYRVPKTNSTPSGIASIPVSPIWALASKPTCKH